MDNLNPLLSNRKTNVIPYLALNIVFLLYMCGNLTSDSIDADATQNLKIGYHLYKSGTLSLYVDSSGDPIPTNYREPLPPVVNALFMYLHPDITQQITFEELQNGPLTKTMKQVNLIWIFILLLGVGYFIYLLSARIWLVYTTWCLVVYYFIHFGGNFNILYTELPAAALIIWCSVFVVKSLRFEKISDYLILGILTGLLILIKASFFYLAIPIFLLITWFKLEKVRLRYYSLFILVGISFVTGPWMLRNYIQFNDVSITSRGGKVAYARMLYNNMSAEEIVGAVYAWGPKLYKDKVTGTTLGATPKDFEKGGKFQAVVLYPTIDSLAIDAGLPDETVRYYSHTLAMEQKNILEFLRLGYNREEAKRNAHKIMKSESLNWMLEQPIQHSAMSVLFFWRGLWTFPNSTIPFVPLRIQEYIHNVINAISYFMLFGLFIYGLFKKNQESIAITLFPVLMLVFYGGLTQNLPRFSEPAIPSMVIGLVFVSYLVWKTFRQDIIT